MAIFDLLTEVKDLRKNDESSTFNGYLEDYLESIENSTDCKEAELLKELFEMNRDLRICVNLRIDVNHEVITNQIIRYKDAFKLAKGALVFPYIIYAKKENAQRALIIYPGEDKDYLFSKGLYYCLTEPLSKYAESKNEIICMCCRDAKKLNKYFDKLFVVKAGAIQREIDYENFQEYATIKNDALTLANEMKINMVEQVNESNDREKTINEAIMKWFLLKKIVYVQYMLCKKSLLEIHGNNVKKQRRQAKKYADDIPFVSYSELWRNVQ